MYFFRQRPKQGSGRALPATVVVQQAQPGSAESYSSNNHVNRDLNDNYNQQDNQQQASTAQQPGPSAGATGSAPTQPTAGASAVQPTVVNFEAGAQKQESFELKQQQSTKPPQSAVATGEQPASNFPIQNDYGQAQKYRQQNSGVQDPASGQQQVFNQV